MSMTKSELVVWVVVAMALGGVVTLAALSRRAPAPPAARATAHEESAGPVESAGVAQRRTSELLPAPAGALSDLPCVERSGREMKTSELRGKFVVADFIFTNCGGPCPVMSGAMARLQEALHGTADVTLVSFTVDPERDTTKVLAEYADRFRADKDRWLFLRAEMPAIREIAYDQLKLVKSRADLVIHSQKFALLDREGRVRAYYNPLSDDDWMKFLVADLDVLRREPAR
jgi:protein SCO1/2